MQAKAVKLDEGWFIKYLPGFDDIKRDVINVDIELSIQEFRELDYKEIRGVAIMERYSEKQQRETREPLRSEDFRMQFRKLFGIQTTNFSAAIKAL
jgi:hypothetical protein